MNKNYQTKYDPNKKEKKYDGLIQVEVIRTYPELYTAGAVLVFFKILENFAKISPN